MSVPLSRPGPVHHLHEGTHRSIPTTHAMAVRSTIPGGNGSSAFGLRTGAGSTPGCGSLGRRCDTCCVVGANLRALVTGGAGFIGSNIVSALAGRDDEVVVIDDLSSGYEANVADLPARFVHASILDDDALEEAIRGAEVVFHVAASVGNKRSIDDPARDVLINALGTVNVLQACRRAGVRKIV